jgi:hypothetical protein
MEISSNYENYLCIYINIKYDTLSRYVDVSASGRFAPMAPSRVHVRICSPALLLEYNLFHRISPIHISLVYVTQIKDAWYLQPKYRSKHLSLRRTLSAGICAPHPRFARDRIIEYYRVIWSILYSILTF